MPEPKVNNPEQNSNPQGQLPQGTDVNNVSNPDQSTGSSGTQEQIPEWLDTGRFGADVEKAKVEQAKAYKESEKKMYEATRKTAELEKKVHEMETLHSNQQGVNYGQSPIASDNVPDNVRTQLESHYGMPFEQIRAIHDITKVVFNPIHENLANSQLENIKNSIRKEDTFFTPDCEKTFDSLIKQYPVEHRLNVKTINDCLIAAKGSNLSSLIELAREEGKRSVNIQPQTPQNVNKPGISNVAGSKPKVAIPDNIKANAAAWGISEDVF